jgi:hypothetical protein
MQTTLQQNIIKEFGLEKLPKEKQSEILTKMTESVLKRIYVNVLEKLSADDITEFEKLQESASQGEIDRFLKAKIDNYEELIFNTIKGFKEEMKETIQSLKQVYGI